MQDRPLTNGALSELNRGQLDGFCFQGLSTKFNICSIFNQQFFMEGQNVFASSAPRELVKPQVAEGDVSFVEAYCSEGYSSGGVSCASGYSTPTNTFWGTGGVTSAGAEDDVLL